MTVQQMSYRPAGAAAGGVEVLSFDRLRAITAGGTQRADFHVLAVVTAGHGSAAVDFTTHALAARSVVWVVPGAVHRWEDLGDLHGDLVLFVPAVPVTPATRALAADPDPVTVWTVSAEDWPLVVAAVEHLRREAAAAAGGPALELPAILLSALLLRLRRPGGRATRADSIVDRFRAAVEEHLREHRDVRWYAATLGYAPRTLTRAVQRATGRTAKGYLTDRIVLEARRLLAHDGFTAARCASELGFPDASSFSVFFRTATGVRPGRWLVATRR